MEIHSKLKRFPTIFFSFFIFLFSVLGLSSCTSSDYSNSYIVGTIQYSAHYSSPETKVELSIPIANNTIYKISSFNISFWITKSDGSIYSRNHSVAFYKTILPGRKKTIKASFSVQTKAKDIYVQEFHANYASLRNSYLGWWITILLLIPMSSIIISFILINENYNFKSRSFLICSLIMTIFPLLLWLIISAINWYAFLLAFIYIFFTALLATTILLIKKIIPVKETTNSISFNPNISIENNREDSEKQEKQDLKCNFCGSEISSDDIYCPKCGKKINVQTLQDSSWIEKYKKQRIIEIILWHIIPLILTIILICCQISDYSEWKEVYCYCTPLILLSWAFPIAALLSIKAPVFNFFDYKVMVYNGSFKTKLIIEGNVVDSGYLHPQLSGTLPNKTLIWATVGFMEQIRCGIGYGPGK